MDLFEALLHAERGAVERFVRFRLPCVDADDVLQEIYFTAYQNFPALKNKSVFKAWILQIARNKCRDYYRQRAALQEIPMDMQSMQIRSSDSRHGVLEQLPVRDTLRLLCEKDRQILYLFYWCDMPQAEIAAHLHIPVGTVKSRLYTAKQNFKSRYPFDNTQTWREAYAAKHAQTASNVVKQHNAAKQHKGGLPMKKLPEFIPDYQIEASTNAPFSVKWEELMGWFLIPKLGESLSWGMYDIPSRKCSHVYDMQVTGKAMVHGIEGVELTAREASYSNKSDVINRTFVAQLTDTHCRYLAALRTDGDIRNYITFLDGDAFLPNWGFGENNCGNETNLSSKGDIKRSGDTVTSADKAFLLDIVGRYTVTIGQKQYDTVCVMDIETYNCGVVSEQFLDHNGRTILWRRFNRNDWAFDRYQKLWTEQLPDNDRLNVNGITYVHWYDCITDYIL